MHSYLRNCCFSNRHQENLQVGRQMLRESWKDAVQCHSKVLRCDPLHRLYSLCIGCCGLWYRKCPKHLTSSCRTSVKFKQKKKKCSQYPSWSLLRYPSICGDIPGRLPLVPVMKQGKHSNQKDVLLFRKANGTSALVQTLEEWGAAPIVERTVWICCIISDPDIEHCRNSHVWTGAYLWRAKQTECTFAIN